MFLGSLLNNSAIILSSEENKTQEVICHSALKSSCPGQWLDHPEAAPEDCAERESTEMTFNSVVLDLNSVSLEGMLVCVIEDENREAQKLFLGVYLSGKNITSLLEDTNEDLDTSQGTQIYFTSVHC